MRVLKHLRGYSGSNVLLIQDEGEIFVRKFGNIKRNLKQLAVLHELDIKVPKIYRVTLEFFDMEFIKGYDMKSFFLNNPVEEFTMFISEVLDKLSHRSQNENFKEVFARKVNQFPWSRYSLSFSPSELLSRLPKSIPISPYHGDLTLENIIYDESGEFILIDPLETEYESFVFDIAKMRQDLECFWFAREDHKPFIAKLASVRDSLEQFPMSDNPILLILMLMRVLPYVNDEADKSYLLREIERVWKL